MGWNQFSRSIYLFSCLLHFHEIFPQFWKWFLMIILYYLIIVSEKDFMKINAVAWNWEWSLIIFSNALLCWSFTNLWTSNLEHPQGPGTDLNKRSLPRPKTITAWKLIPHRSKISKNWNPPLHTVILPDWTLKKWGLSNFAF